MDDFIQSKQVGRAVQYYNPLKRPKFKTFASKSVIKKENVKTIHLLIYYVKLHMLQPLMGALILETCIVEVKMSNVRFVQPALHCLICYDKPRA